MNDRELLELAAKAAGRKWLSYHHQKGLCCRDDSYGGLIEYYWNPLTDDGDALRLAVKLRFSLEWWKTGVSAESQQHGVGVIHDFEGDPQAATRSAIVYSAAEIGKSL